MHSVSYLNAHILTNKSMCGFGYRYYCRKLFTPPLNVPNMLILGIAYRHTYPTADCQAWMRSSAWEKMKSTAHFGDCCAKSCATHTHTHARIWEHTHIILFLSVSLHLMEMKCLWSFSMCNRFFSLVFFFGFGYILAFVCAIFSILLILLLWVLVKSIIWACQSICPIYFNSMILFWDQI